jgi:hypothetical protein
VGTPIVSLLVPSPIRTSPSPLERSQSPPATSSWTARRSDPIPRFSPSVAFIAPSVGTSPVERSQVQLDPSPRYTAPVSVARNFAPADGW